MVCLFYKSMMQFTFVTRVSAQRDQVADQFNQSLLLKLKPPLVTMELLRYDGQHRGDELAFAVGFGKSTQQWHGAITQHRYTQLHWLFRDEGISQARRNGVTEAATTPTVGAGGATNSCRCQRQVCGFGILNHGI